MAEDGSSDGRPEHGSGEDDLAALHRWKADLDAWIDTVLESSTVERGSTQVKDPEPGPILPTQVGTDRALDSTTKAPAAPPVRLPVAGSPVGITPPPPLPAARTEPAWHSRPVRRTEAPSRSAPLGPLPRPRRLVQSVPAAPPSARPRRRRYLSPVVLALVLGVVALGFLFIRFTDDSSFVTWRYGATWLHTQHWAGDPKGGPGSSSFAWAALSIVPVLLHVPTELFFKGVSVGLLVGFAVWTHRLRLPRAQQFLLLAIAAFSPVFFIQLFSGAETVAFALGVSTLFAGLYRTGRFGPVGWATAIGLVLLRPEGLGYAAVAVLWALVLDRRALHAAGAAVVTVCAGSYWTARAAYFGQPLPRSLPVAVHDWLAWDRFPAGGVVLAATPVALVVLLVGRRRLSPQTRLRVFGPMARRDATPLVLALTAALVLLDGYRQSLLPTDYANRSIWLAAFPVLAVALCRPLIVRRPTQAGELLDGWALIAIVAAAGAVVAAIVDPYAERGALLTAGAALVVGVTARIAVRDRGATAVAATGLAVLISWLPATDAVAFAAYRYRLQDSHAALGELLRDSHLTGAIASADAGVLPFRLPGGVIDLADTGRPVLVGELTQAQVQVVIGISRAADAPVIESTGGQLVADAWAASSGFRFLPGPQFESGYWLNLWVDPAVATPAFVSSLNALRQRSIVDNGRSDAQLVRRHLFDFPFLHASSS